MQRLSPLFGLVSLMLIALALPLRADEAVVCLQKQLAALGLDPGPLDGSVGPATLRALEAFEAADGDVADRPLDAFSALVFCRELGLTDAALKRHWPSFGRRLRIEIAGTPDSQLRSDLLFEASAALSKVETLFDVDLVAPVNIVFGSNATEIADRAIPPCPILCWCRPPLCQAPVQGCAGLWRQLKPLARSDPVLHAARRGLDRRLQHPRCAQ